MAKKTKLPYPHSNLGKYLHKPKYKAKLASEPKISKDVAKKSKSPPTIKKPSRTRIKKMQTPKGI